VIRSFGDKATEHLYNGVRSKDSRKFSAVTKVASRKLDMIHAAQRLDDLSAPPANRLEALHGDLKGFHSIRVNDQFRIIFRWNDDGAHEVQLIDYHD
jgi:toxin HigB-1